MKIKPPMLANLRAFGKWKVSNNAVMPEKINTDRQAVENIFDGDGGKARHQRHAIAYQRRLGRLGHEHAGERHDVAERVAHQTRSESIAEAKPIGSFKTPGPRDGPHHVTNRRDSEHQQEPGAEPFDIAQNFTHAGALHEVAKQQKTGQGKDYPDGREPFR